MAKAKAKKATRGKRPKSVMQKAWATRRAKKEAAAAAARAAEGFQGSAGRPVTTAMMDTDTANDNRAQQSATLSPRGLPNTAPGQGEIVGGADDALTAKLMKLSRKKGGDILVKTEIMQALATARFEARNEAEQRTMNQIAALRQEAQDRMICGFIAEIGHLQQAHRGLPTAMTHIINTPTVIAIVDALAKAGYHAGGKR